MNKQQSILRIALDVPLARFFDYLNQNFDVRVGNRVIVPFSGRNLIGVVVDIVSESDVPLEKLKAVSHVFDDVAFDDANLQLMQFCAQYYHYPLGQILISTLPKRLRQLKPAKSRKSYLYKLVKQPDEAQISKRQVVLQRIVTALTQNQALTQQQLAEISGSWRKAINTLLDWQCVEAEEVIAVKPSMASSNVEPTLNAEQETVIQSVLKTPDEFKPWLLYGVTGSGKTEVYIQLLKSVLATANTQVLVLVPEINLTPQLEARFRSRLSEYSLVTLHSSLSEGERLQNWLAAKSGTARIVIGTRLSIFTPLPNLKMILIDEEHDGSYKQQDGIRYHARDVAMMRAKQLRIPIVLGSATPSLESWHNATQKENYGLLKLTERAVSNASLPKIFCIDTAKSPVENGLSLLLIKAIRARLAKGEQSLLFLNRRGYAPVLHCTACQWSSACQRCSAKLVVHLSQRRLKCHHCGSEQKIPVQCPDCGNPDLHPVGIATQKLTQTLTQLFPEASIARVDRDSVRNKDALTELLTRVHAGEVDLLVGTQMLAKGHDFPNLTLVGVLDTDTALHSPDFRATERLFSQLMQVAGRAGRAEKSGEVLIQSAFPDHDLFKALRAHDYESYTNNLLNDRQLMQFPPVSYFALLKAEASDYAVVQGFLTMAMQAAREQAVEGLMIYDPVRPQMERLKGLERGHLLMQSQHRQALQGMLKTLVPQLRAQKLAKQLRWVLDIDPLEF